MAKVNSRDLAFLAELIAAGGIAPVIETRCRLEEVPAAIGYLTAGQPRGKVVVDVG